MIYPTIIYYIDTCTLIFGSYPAKIFTCIFPTSHFLVHLQCIQVMDIFMLQYNNINVSASIALDAMGD